MKTSEQIEQEFKTDFYTLLEKYGAYLEYDNYYGGEIVIPTKYDGSKIISEFCSFNLNYLVD